MPEFPVAAPLPAADTLLREVQAAREIAHAFLTAASPAEVYRLALERVSPLVGAAFASVFLRENGPVLRLAAAWNWPPEYAAFLGETRVRLGAGPTGVAAGENRVVEVHDVFADPALDDWWEVARELGFASAVSLPLLLDGQPEGAITFYFRDAGAPRPHDRHLLRLVADQLSATAEKAHLIDDLQRANALLRLQNVELEARFREAEEARRLRGELLANVSHELRTPLTAILGYAFLLRDTGRLPDDAAAQVVRIEEAGSQLLRLIEDLLDLNSLQLGRLEPQVETCDAVALLRAAMSGIAPPPPHLEVRVDVPDATVPVRTDPSQVVRILRHLVSNAFKFTFQGGVALRVRMSSGSPWSDEARRTGDARHLVVWEVEDTGIGMDEAALDRVFDEFRQADGSATRRFGGVGIGLALSRQLARRLGGDISVRSEPGRGSLFVLALPAGLGRVGGGD
ncbi:HAMP domain-containing sensor histidine kinase [Longimicrobium sp.]|uniref:GAF domain-containing sensor histidine kinase n=1 Tax=Longimicrobium sp. TaxID=2029185 RepID=UPI002BBCA411|nr:HAMP domain-containing sensor histidine kinase [Longimicrobium sp.]HSU14208.1 HAMP domain-containing sensor histidine kinase [Longimicrobium sp.]